MPKMDELEKVDFFLRRSRLLESLFFLSFFALSSSEISFYLKFSRSSSFEFPYFQSTFFQKKVEYLPVLDLSISSLCTQEGLLNCTNDLDSWVCCPHSPRRRKTWLYARWSFSNFTFFYYVCNWVFMLKLYKFMGISALIYTFYRD